MRILDEVYCGWLFNMEFKKETKVIRPHFTSEFVASVIVAGLCLSISWICLTIMGLIFNLNFSLIKSMFRHVPIFLSVLILIFYILTARRRNLFNKFIEKSVEKQRQIINKSALIVFVSVALLLVFININ